MRSLFIHMGDEVGEVQLVYAEHFAWCEGLFLTQGEIRVLFCVFSILHAVGSSTCVCVCVYAHTHTHCTWGTRCEPRGRDETPGGPK